MINLGLIEDDPYVLEYYKAFFKKSSKLNCILAVDSVEKFLKYIRSHQTYDIILIDIGLPGMSGIEGLSILRKKMPATELIMFTAYQDNDKIFKAFRAGASGYLLKTISEKEFEGTGVGLATVKRVVKARW